MFCPKCGNNLPDNATFCSKCGKKMEGQKPVMKPAATPVTLSTATATGGSGASVVQPSSAGITVSGLNITVPQILSATFAFVAIIFASLPWFITSDALIAAGRAGAAMTSWLSHFYDYRPVTFDPSYTVLQLPDLMNDFAYYYSGTRPGMSGNLPIIVGAWVVAVILMIAGAIYILLKGKKAVLICGLILMVAFVGWYLGWYLSGFYNVFVAEGYAYDCMNPVYCAIACFVSFIFAVATKSQEKKQAEQKAESEQPQQPEKSDTSEQSATSEQSDSKEQPEQSEQPQHLDQQEQAQQSEQEQSQPSEEAQQPEEPIQPVQDEQQALSEQKTICPQCGKENSSKAAFCGECGTPLKA